MVAMFAAWGTKVTGGSPLLWEPPRPGLRHPGVACRARVDRPLPDAARTAPRASPPLSTAPCVLPRPADRPAPDPAAPRSTPTGAPGRSTDPSTRTPHKPPATPGSAATRRGVDGLPVGLQGFPAAALGGVHGASRCRTCVTAAGEARQGRRYRAGATDSPSPPPPDEGAPYSFPGRWYPSCATRGGPSRTCGRAAPGRHREPLPATTNAPQPSHAVAPL
jgi:hypothetical protein